MTPTTLKRIAIALGVVLLLWSVAELLGGRSDRLRDQLPLRAVTPPEADTVELRRADDTLRLVKDSAGVWTVNGYAASADAVRELFASFTDTLRADLAARSPSSHARMGVDSAGGRRLRIVAGDRLLVDLWVGGRGNVWESVFVRPAGDDRVYELRGRLAALADRPRNDWRDKTIVTVVPDSVTRLAVERGRRRYALERADGGWQFADGAAADSAEVARLLDAFRRVTAQGASFATDEEAAQADFGRPDRRVTLLGDTGDMLAVLAFDSTDAGFWVRRGAGGPVFQLYRWRVDELTPEDSVLRGR